MCPISLGQFRFPLVLPPRKILLDFSCVVNVCHSNIFKKENDHEKIFLFEVSFALTGKSEPPLS